MFAEGCVSNGKNLSRFRRGGFAAGLAVQPYFIKYNYTNVSPDYASLVGLTLAIL